MTIFVIFFFTFIGFQKFSNDFRTAINFVDVGGVLFKVYIVGEAIKVVRRFSLPDVTKRELSKNAGVFRFPRVSCAAASADDADLDPCVAGELILSKNTVILRFIFMKFLISLSNTKWAFHYRILFELFSLRDEQGCLAFGVGDLMKGPKALCLISIHFCATLLLQEEFCLRHQCDIYTCVKDSIN